MPTAGSTKKKSAKKISADNQDPLSSSGVSSLSGIGLYNTKKITIFKNGDRFHRGIKFIINPRVIKDLEPLMNQINDRIELSHGVKKLYSADGKPIKAIKQLEDGKIYVAASAQFISMRYGDFQEKVWKPPSRKHSPIFGEDRIKTARTRSQEPRQRKAARDALPQEARVPRSVSVKNIATRKPVVPTPAAPAKRKENGKPKATPAAKPPVNTTKPKPKPKPAEVPRPKVRESRAPVKSQPPRRKTPKTAASVASSVMPQPVKSGAAQILEFPEVEKVVNVETIHKTPTPPAKPKPRSPSPEELEEEEEEVEKKEEPKSVSAIHSEDEDKETEFSSDGEPEEEGEASGSEEEAESEEEGEEEEEEEEDEEEVGTDSEVNTPSSRKSSSAESGVEDDKNHKKKDAKK